MQKLIVEEILKLNNKAYVDQTVFKKFLHRINSVRTLTKDQGTGDHICVFFLPIYSPIKSIYLVHHIKADDWIPPGGHINQNELPIDTVRREFNEELDHQLTDEKIELFDLSIKQINRPYQNCQTHYDIWYLVYTKKLPFKFLRKEFYDAGWFDLSEGIKKVKLKKYRNIVKKLRLIL